MGPYSGTCEIVESNEELNSIQHDRGTSPPSSEFGADEKAGKLPILIVERPYSVEDDLNQLFEAIDLRLSGRRSGLSHKLCTDLSRKSALKRPITVSGSRASGIGVSESGSLKQALRGLCLSHASEMAAMKRLSKPTGQSRGSEAGAIKRLYKAVVVEASESGLPLGKGKDKESVLELPVVPEKEISNTCENVSESLKISKTKPKSRSANSSPRLAVATTSKVPVNKTLPKDEIAIVLSKDKKDLSVQKLGHKGKLKAAPSSSSSNTTIRELELDEIIPASTEVGRRTSILEVYSLPCSPSSRATSPTTEPMASSPRMGKPVLMNKSFIKKKLKQVSASSPTRFSRQNEGNKSNNTGLHPNSSKLVCEIHNCNEKNDIKHSASSASSASSSTSLSVGVSSSNAALSASKPGLSSNICVDRTTGAKASESSRSKEKGESSQSSKSSIGEYSSSTTTTSISEDSILSGSNYTGSRPHMSKDLRWDAIHHVEMQHGGIGLKHFKLLKRLGCGDIGTVYLAELTGTNGLFALKVMDNEFLASRKKLIRAQTEREILQMLDHPFLPTLFAYFTTGKFSCLVMEYCPGGDLHILRQRQDSRTFSEQAARFYLAEVLLALEYLHMLGVVYRDLKPENILVREDGHIMLSDFDLSLRCTVSPILIKCSSVNEPTKKVSHPCLDSSCIDPFCLQPSWSQVPCFTPKLITSAPKTQKPKPDPKPAASLLPELVAEPTSARSNSFVGTHEYLAPEIIKAEGHGNAVDWWTFGIFLYELLFGKTPFKGPGNDETLANVVFQTLKFPETPSVSSQAKDLIRGLLIKEPDNRLGSVKGATEIRQHPFFEGLNWALIRCAIPPELPKCHDPGVPANEIQKSECVIEYCPISTGEQQHLEFRMF